jgi:hypothetical protein
MESAKKVAILGPNVEISTSPIAAATAAGLGIVAGGGVFYLLSRAGASLGLAALGGAVLGGIGAFAVVARARYWEEDAPSEEEAAEVVEASPGAEDAAQIVCYLLKHLGDGVTAYLAGLEPENKELVGLWASAEALPNAVELGRLRSTFYITRLILEVYDGETVQAWLFGMNQWLDDEAPAYVLRHGSQPEVWKPVEEAALAFMGS